MASFIEDLWNSVFTPGTTPTLLIATNVTFGALQLLLLLLLIGTHSIHFIILSVLSGGLWYSINWFAAELSAAQSKEAEAAAKKNDDAPASPAGITSEDSDTETEEVPVSQASIPPDSAVATSASLAPTLQEQPVKKRRSLGESGYISTDSEWEKVDESDEKDK